MKKTFTLFLSFLSIWTKGQVMYFPPSNAIPVIRGTDTLYNAWTGGINSSTVATCDLDLDGILDLVLYDRQQEKALVFATKGTRFVYTPALAEPLPLLSKYALFYDYDGDGKKDLFTSSPIGIRVYKNISTATSVGFKLTKDPIFTRIPGGNANMDISTVDIPSLVDVDNDGDMDIIHFRASQGSSVDLELNQSKEKYGRIDSLEFKNPDNCWGGFYEFTCKVFGFGYDCKSDFRLSHVGGGAVLALDVDNDGDKDILVGKEDCSSLNFLENKGNTTNAVFNKLITAFPSSYPVEPLSYPLPFYEDLNFDGKKDLIVTMGLPSPNFIMDLAHNLWFYQNTNTAANPTFDFQSQNFLQSTMIDWGRNAHPALVDIDFDGDQDLFVSNGSGIASQPAIVAFYENRGTMEQPSFYLTDPNFLDFGSIGYDQLKITFSDLNGDNLSDLIVFSKKGNLFESKLYPNISSSSITFGPPNSLGITMTTLSTPYFTDMDGDGLKDLLIGDEEGNLNQFKNIGNATSPTFSLVTTSLGGISPNSTYTNGDLSIAVADLDEDSKVDLITADNTGFIKVYKDFKNQTSPIWESTTIITSATLPQSLGRQLSIATGDLDGDGKNEILVGSVTGGVQLLASAPLPTGMEKVTSTRKMLEVYPNPASEIVEIKLYSSGELKIVDIVGNPVLNYKNDGPETFKITSLAKGLYVLTFYSQEGHKSSQKLVIH